MTQRSLKQQALAVCLLLGLLTAAPVALTAAPAELVGQAAPDFALPDLAGSNLRLSEYRSEVVVLNFWSDWCGRCGSVMPVLNSLQAQHGADGLRVLAIDIEGDAAEAQQLTDAFSLAFPVLLDTDQQVSRLYDLNNVPVTLLIDREGNVRYVQEGFKGSAPEQLAAEVAALVRE